MKSIITSIAALSLLIFGAQAFAPRDAQAVLLVEMAMDHRPVLNLPEVVLCVIALPICVLDDKSSPPTSYSQQDLLDNGYDMTQVNAIEADEASVLSNLQSRNLSMVIESSDTYSSIATALRAIDPAVSSDYIDFVADINHVAIPQN
jgi:hypothetical protein